MKIRNWLRKSNRGYKPLFRRSATVVNKLAVGAMIEARTPNTIERVNVSPAPTERQDRRGQLWLGMSARQPQALPVFLQRHHLVLGIESRVPHHDVQMVEIMLHYFLALGLGDGIGQTQEGRA